MFEDIQFYTYEIADPVTSAVLKNKMSSNSYPENIKNADFSISGSIYSFSKPPIKDFALQNLYHMEAFSVFSCKNNFYTQRKDYDSFLILYTYKGHGQLEYEGKTYFLSEGDGFFIDCRLPHLYRMEGDYWEHSVLHLNGPLMASLFEQYCFNGSVVFSQLINGIYQTGLEKLLAIYKSVHPYRDWQASDCISHILTGLLTDSSAGSSSTVPDILQTIVKYMEKNFASSITLNSLSLYFGISKYYLSREFKKYTGFSPNDYLIRLRVDQSKILLLTTNLPANKIAHTVGIHDMNNFTNLFKKKTGMTPGQFRKQYI